MKLYSLKYYICTYGRYFMFSDLGVDLTFIRGNSGQQFANTEKGLVPVLTPNVLYLDYKTDFQTHDLPSSPILPDVLRHRDFIRTKFPISSFVNYGKIPIHVLKDIQIAVNIVKVVEFDNETFETDRCLQLIDNRLHWNITYLCSLVPKNLRHEFTHRILFCFYHEDFGYFDFEHRELQLDCKCP